MTEQEFNATYPWVKAYEDLAMALKGEYEKLTDEQKNKGDYSPIVNAAKEAFKDAEVEYPITQDQVAKWFHLSEDAAQKTVTEDIDPFTIFQFCNVNWKGKKREGLVKAILSKFGVTPPETLNFAGIPIIPSQADRIFHMGHDEKTKKETGYLWAMFVSLLMDDWDKTFKDNYEKIKDIKGWGGSYLKLFWVQPRKFLPLDKTSTEFSRFREYVGCDPKELKDSARYLAKCKELASASPKGLPFGSFVEFSRAAYDESESKKSEKKHGKTTDSQDTTVANQTTTKQTESPVSSDADKIYKLSKVLVKALSECEKVPEFQSVDPRAFLRERQKIWFGAPGTGKSFKVNELAKSLEKNGGQYFRTTFHPDYDYATFVGCYKPCPEGKKETEITYKFVPQVFTKAYVAAWKSWMSDEPKPVALVIEEINRGNCAQIFGQIFQLLDRDKFGFSEYRVSMDQDLRRFLLASEIKDAPYVEGGELVLPPNFFIFATMNTSDQSLFPMDSAFKRRWGWEYVPIRYAGTEDWKIAIGDKEYSWNDFLEKINKVILKELKSPDKQLGERFVKAGEGGLIDQKTFVNKVMFYLIGDAFKDDSTIREICKGDSDDKTEIVFADFADETKVDGKDKTKGTANLEMFFNGLDKEEH